MNEEIEFVRGLYKEIDGYSERVWINRRVDELMLEKYKIEVARQVRDIWISGRRKFKSPHDAEWIVCYTQAFKERGELERAATAGVQALMTV